MGGDWCGELPRTSRRYQHSTRGDAYATADLDADGTQRDRARSSMPTNDAVMRCSLPGHYWELVAIAGRRAPG